MPYRLTRLYTRQGDEGYTSLAGHRLSKDDLLIEALGTLDELNSTIGLIISLQMKNQELEEALNRIQHELFDMGGELHLPERVTITAENVIRLEQQLDQWNSTLPPLKEFLLPQGNMLSATTHVARTVCRRAERCLVKLHRQIALSNIHMLSYLNRLSDLLFVMARVLARENSVKEITWEQNRDKE